MSSRRRHPESTRVAGPCGSRGRASHSSWPGAPSYRVSGHRPAVAGHGTVSRDRTPRRRVLWPIWSEQGDALLERPAQARRGKSGHLPIKPTNDGLQLVRDSRRLCSRLRPPCTMKRARAEGRWPWALPVAPAGSARAHSPPIVRGRASRGWVSCGSVSCRIGLPAESTRSFHRVAVPISASRGLTRLAMARVLGSPLGEGIAPYECDRLWERVTGREVATKQLRRRRSKDRRTFRSRRLEPTPCRCRCSTW